MTFYVAAEKQGNFIVSSEKESISATVTSVPTQIRLPLDLYPDSRVNVSFIGDMGRMDLPLGETRDLHFYLMDVNLLPTYEK